MIKSFLAICLFLAASTSQALGCDIVAEKSAYSHNQLAADLADIETELDSPDTALISTHVLLAVTGINKYTNNNPVVFLKSTLQFINPRAPPATC